MLELDHVVRSGRAFVVVYVCVILVTDLVIWKAVPHWQALTWSAAYLSFALLRAGATSLYEREAGGIGAGRLRRWRGFLLVSATTHGLILGSPAFWAFTSLGFERQLLLTWVVMVMCITVAAYVASLRVAMRLMMAGAMIPYAVVWALNPAPDGLPMPLVMLGAYAMNEFVCLRQSRSIMARIDLAVRNEELVEEVRRQNAILEEASSGKTRMLAAACHDLRQPVHALGMLVETMAPGDPPAQMAQRLASVRRSVDALAEMLSSLMDLSRLDSGHYAPQPQVVAVDAVLEDLELHFAGAADKRGLTLEIERCGLHVVSDPQLLRRILSNLVSNAVKYTERGGVTLQCGAQGDVLVLSVRDTGIGIPQDQLANVFQDYVRLASRRQQDGLGIGLAVVRRAADLLGHRVTLASSMGAGTCVQLELMLADAPAATAPAPLSAEVASPDTPLTVMVIENDDESRDAIAALLSLWGYDAVVGRDSQEAIERLGAGRSPDVVVSDFHLGHEEGIAAIARVRASVNAPGLPALLITGDLDPLVVRRTREGEITLAHKPLSARRLKEMLHAAALWQPA